MFRILLPLALLPRIALAAPVDQAEPPAAIRQVLEAEATETDQLLDSMRGWEMDLEGDGTTEWMVQAAYAFRGGNAVYARTFFFDGADAGFSPWKEVEFNRSIKRVDKDGLTISVTIYELLDSDPRCCPSGESVRTMLIRP